MIAIAVGVISTVPGGVGVFESMMLVLLPTVARDGLLGALLAYRAIYYLLPFAIALALLGSHEIWVHRDRLNRILGLLRTWASAVTPQAAALAVFFAGAILLFSGATPAVDTGSQELAVQLTLANLRADAAGLGLAMLIMSFAIVATVNVVQHFAAKRGRAA